MKINHIKDDIFKEFPILNIESDIDNYIFSYNNENNILSIISNNQTLKFKLNSIYEASDIVNNFVFAMNIDLKNTLYINNIDKYPIDLYKKKIHTITMGYYYVMKNPYENYVVAYFNPHVKGKKNWQIHNIWYDFHEIYCLNRYKIEF